MSAKWKTYTSDISALQNRSERNTRPNHNRSSAEITLYSFLFGIIGRIGVAEQVVNVEDVDRFDIKDGEKFIEQTV